MTSQSRQNTSGRFQQLLIYVQKRRLLILQLVTNASMQKLGGSKGGEVLSHILGESICRHAYLDTAM